MNTPRFLLTFLLLTYFSLSINSKRIDIYSNMSIEKRGLSALKTCIIDVNFSISAILASLLPGP